MTSIDLFKHYPSARLGTAEVDPAELRAARSTTLDIQPSTRRRKADPNRVAQILSRLITLIEGRPLTDWFPVAEGVPAIIGVQIDDNLFDEFGGAFIEALQELGFTPVVPRARADDEDRLKLAAGAMGVGSHTKVRRDTPPNVMMFDQFLTLMPADVTALHSGDGIPPDLHDAVSALAGIAGAASASGDPAALRQAGTGFGALVAALHAVVNAGNDAGQRMRRVGPSHYVAPGYRSTRRATHAITCIEVDGEWVDMADAEIDPVAGRVRRRGRRHGENTT